MTQEPKTLDHDEIEEQQLIDRYLLGQLPAPEAQRFEVHYLSCPTCMERLELTETLLHGLRRATAQDAAVLQGGFLAAVLRRRWLAPAIALLMMLLPAGILLKLGQRDAELQGIRGELQGLQHPQAGTPYLPMSPLRDGGVGAPSHHLRLPTDPASVVLALELDPPLAAGYRVALFNEEDQQLWESARFAPNGFDSLVLTLPSTFLAPGDYQLRAIPDTGSAIRFPLRVLPPP